MTTESQTEALNRAVTGPSMANYAAIFQGFIAKGIDESDIKPRENVFGFDAWKALGRQVMKGEHGVKICTWVPMTKKDASGEVQPIGRKPRMTTVFHVSQTKALEGASEQAIPERAPETKPAATSAKVRPAMVADDYFSTEFTRIGA